MPSESERHLAQTPDDTDGARVQLAVGCGSHHGLTRFRGRNRGLSRARFGTSRALYRTSLDAGQQCPMTTTQYTSGIWMGELSGVNGGGPGLRMPPVEPGRDPREPAPVDGQVDDGVRTPARFRARRRVDRKDYRHGVRAHWFGPAEQRFRAARAEPVPIGGEQQVRVFDHEDTAGRMLGSERNGKRLPHLAWMYRARSFEVHTGEGRTGRSCNITGHQAALCRISAHDQVCAGKRTRRIRKCRSYVNSAYLDRPGHYCVALKNTRDHSPRSTFGNLRRLPSD